MAHGFDLSRLEAVQLIGDCRKSQFLTKFENLFVLELQLFR